MDIHSELNDVTLTRMIAHLMCDEYDLGEPRHIKEILGGYNNRSFAVQMYSKEGVKRFFLRLYNPGVLESEVLFELALLEHFRANGFTLAAASLPSRNGQTLMITPAPDCHEGSKALWVLFEFLEGEDKYTWVDTNLTDKEFASAAAVLASLHNSGYGFKQPPGTDRVQPRIMDFIHRFKKSYDIFRNEARDRRCDKLFIENFTTICEALEVATSYKSQFFGMLELPIHCDYHPGNLKYHQEQAVGIFDFDWSKIDFRLFDLALGLVYFASAWEEGASRFVEKKFNLFLHHYNKTCHELSVVEPLTKQEQQNLIPMLLAADLYLLHWCLVDFYTGDGQDDDEYHYYISHCIALMKWIRSHESDLNAWIQNVFKG